MSVKRVLVLPDLHVPVHDRATVAAVEKYMGDHPWDRIVQLGDFMDFDMISSHNIGNIRENEARRIVQDYAEGNRVLDRWQRLAPKTAFTILEGNHDYRIEAYVDKHPEVEGLAEVEQGLHLRERGIEWVRSWSQGEVFRIGKARFIHGLYTNEHHAKKHLAAFGNNIFYGHTHDFQQHSMTTKGDGETRVGQSLGCLLDYRQRYMKGRPDKWQQGFAVFHFHQNGYFQYFPVRVFDHKFVSPEGKSYGERRR